MKDDSTCCKRLLESHSSGRLTPMLTARTLIENVSLCAKNVRKQSDPDESGVAQKGETP